MRDRSEVAYSIRFKTKEHRVRFMNNQATNNSEIKLSAFKLIDEKTILFYLENVKWYAEYERVKQHQALLELAKAEGCGWEFCRAGEDAGDVEQEGDRGNIKGFEVECPQIMHTCQNIYVESEGEDYPIDPVPEGA